MHNAQVERNGGARRHRCLAHGINGGEQPSIDFVVESNGPLTWRAHGHSGEVNGGVHSNAVD